MNRPSKCLLSVLSLCWLALPAHAATGVGPYYATPSWDQTLPAETRFVVLTNMKSEAVLDRETGLVWERAPRIEFGGGVWHEARWACYFSSIGGRRGWRVPTITELASLADDLRDPGLGVGHPFELRPLSLGYWSGTEVLTNTNGAYYRATGIGRSGIVVLVETAPKDFARDTWCVRGPSSTP